MQAITRSFDIPANHSAFLGPDNMRGRTRNRSHPKPTLTVERADKVDSSTFRGRSRQRASSPYEPNSRNPSSAMLSPTRQVLINNHLRDARREHCPSRPARASSPSQATTLQQRRHRAPSRNRGPGRLEGDMPSKSVDAHSSLRHQVHVDKETSRTSSSAHNA